MEKWKKKKKKKKKGKNGKKNLKNDLVFFSFFNLYLTPLRAQQGREEIDKVGEEEEKLDMDVVGGGWFRGAGTIRTSSLRRPGGGPNSPRSEPVDHHSS